MVAVVEDADGGRWTVPLVVAGGAVRRAEPGDGVAEAVVRGLADLRRARRPRRAHDVRGHRPRRQRCDPRAGVARRGRERRARRRRRPDRRVGRRRRGRRGEVGGAPARGAGSPGAARRRTARGPRRPRFAETPRPGAAALRRPRRRPATILLASVTAYLPGRARRLGLGGRGRRAACARGESDAEAALAPAARLGALTARMHAALAASDRGPRHRDDVGRWQSAGPGRPRRGGGPRRRPRGRAAAGAGRPHRRVVHGARRAASARRLSRSTATCTWARCCAAGDPPRLRRHRLRRQPGARTGRARGGGARRASMSWGCWRRSTTSGASCSSAPRASTRPW